ANPLARDNASAGKTRGRKSPFVPKLTLSGNPDGTSGTWTYEPNTLPSCEYAFEGSRWENPRRDQRAPPASRTSPRTTASGPPGEGAGAGSSRTSVVPFRTHTPTSAPKAGKTWPGSWRPPSETSVACSASTKFVANTSGQSAPTLSL